MRSQLILLGFLFIVGDCFAEYQVPKNCSLPMTVEVLRERPKDPIRVDEEMVWVLKVEGCKQYGVIPVEQGAEFDLPKDIGRLEKFFKEPTARMILKYPRAGKNRVQEFVVVGVKPSQVLTAGTEFPIKRVRTEPFEVVPKP